MWPRVAGPRRLLGTTFIVLIVWTVVLWIFLPYDNPVLLLFRFVIQKTFSFLRVPFDDERWLYELPEFPVDLSKDVALVIKTGYGTQERVPALFDALEMLYQKEDDYNILVVGDFSTQYQSNGQKLVVHDVVAAVMEDDRLRGVRHMDRFDKYRNMTAAIKKGHKKQAKDIAKKVGWELDALKFIPGLELAYRTFPGKKWYIIQDDDTYMVKPSLELILGHFDPLKPFYLGNVVGDFKGRFAHGGSGIILSQMAMSQLFDANPDVVYDALVNSLTETWGDKLVATTFLKIGIYLEERYSHFFNGERPSITKMRASRFCSPIVSFHGLADPSQMRQVGDMFQEIDQPVFWSQLWEIYDQPDLSIFERNPMRLGHDHVGRLDEETMTTRNVNSVDKCLAICNRHFNTCLAWTWDRETHECHISPWVIIGEKAKTKFSGMNVQRMKKMMRECGS